MTYLYARPLVLVGLLPGQVLSSAAYSEWKLESVRLARL